MSGAALIGWIAGVHLLGLACVAFLMWPALKDNPLARDRPSEGGDDGGGGGPKVPPTRPEPPRGGLPLPDAEPAKIRLREHGTLGERLPRRDPPPRREPDRRPAPTPHRSSRTGLGRTRR